MFDMLAHPDLVKHWGRERPWPEKDLRFYYDIAMEGIAESGVAIEVSTAGLRKPVGEIYPRRAFLEMVVDAGNPIALSRDAHTPEQLGFEYDQALELLDDVGVKELAVFERRASAAGADRDEHAAPASAGTRTGSSPGGPLILGGVERSSTTRPRRPLRRRRPDPRGDRRAAGRGRPGRHRPALPGHRRRFADADSIELLRERRRAPRPPAGPSVHVDTTVMMERPKLARRRAAIRASLAAALGVAADAVNIKATTGEGMGFVGRGEGVAALAVVTVERDRLTRMGSVPSGTLDLVVARRARRRRGVPAARVPHGDPVPDPARDGRAGAGVRPRARRLRAGPASSSS